MRFSVIVLFLLLMSPAGAQELPEASENPLAQLKELVDGVLAAEGVPFTADQEDAITLMMEDRRQASEDLFGGLLDFRSGPTEGQESDRLRSAIEWMRDEFITRLTDYLTPAQQEAWEAFVAGGGLEATAFAGEPGDEQSQTQYVRINSNPFTAEDSSFRFDRNGGGGGRPATEVIRRGGTGAFHGNAQFLLKDDALNARNPFAGNKPPYQERQTSFDVSGPLLPGRLTTAFGFRQDEAENVDTIHATLPDGVFELGIVRPTTRRFFTSGNTLQLSDRHSVSVDLEYATDSRRNQGIGGFTLPERAYTSSASDWRVDIQQFSTFSPETIYETRFSVTGNRDETVPVGEGVQINVLDAFSRGGAQNRSENTRRAYDFSNMYTRLGEAWTLKTGMESVYRTNTSFSEDNFEGRFTFSSLEAFREGRPLNYRVNQGDPRLDIDQWEFAFFVQNDFQLTPRFTLMLGARYQVQTNVADRNNFAPRLGVAWAVGRATVLRTGVAVFHQPIEMSVFETHRRLNGTRQFGIIVDNPSFPDPFESGTVRERFPTVRVTDPDLVTPYNVVGMLAVERTFLTNLLFTASYDFNREFHRLRLRNLNAPLPGCIAALGDRPSDDAVRACRPQPDEGNILNLESTAGEWAHTFRMSFRQRFSIFNVNAGYRYFLRYADTGPNNPRLPMNNYDLAADWSGGSAAPHSFEGTVNAQLPLGVFLTGRVTANSGRLYSITTGRDDNRDGEVNDRPPGEPRFSLPGPSFFSVDFNISKAFFLGGGSGGNRTNVNLFANMTNAFNHTNPGQPSGVLTSPNFGRSTSAQNPREIEAGIRFQF